MMRLLRFADLHLGTENNGRLNPATRVNGRVPDFLAGFDELIDYALGHEEMTDCELLNRYLEIKDTAPGRIKSLLQHAERIFHPEEEG